MVSSRAAFEPRSVWGLLGQSLAIYVRHFGTLFGISAAIFLPLALLKLASVVVSLPALLPSLLSLLPEAPPEPPVDLGSYTLSLVASYCLQGLALLWAVLIPLGEGALAHAVVGAVLGQAPGIRASFSAAGKRFLDLWLSRVIHDVVVGVLSVIVSISAGLALVVFVTTEASELSTLQAALGIVAGLVGLVALVGLVIVALLWSFRAQPVVAEQADAIQALKRSAALAKGNLLRLSGRFLILVSIQGVVLVGLVTVAGIIAAISFAASPSATNIVFLGAIVASYAVTLLADQFLAPWYSIFVTLNYLDLRARKGDLPVVSSASPALEQALRPAPAPTSTAPPSSVGAATPPVALRGWEGVDPEKLSPGQRASYLFERIRAEGESARLLNDLGLAFMEIGDVGGAVEVLRRARALDPNDADIAFNLALAYRQRRDLESARQMMREYFRLETNADDLARVRNSPFLRDILPDQQ